MHVSTRGRGAHCTPWRHALCPKQRCPAVSGNSVGVCRCHSVSIGFKSRARNTAWVLWVEAGCRCPFLRVEETITRGIARADLRAALWLFGEHVQCAAQLHAACPCLLCVTRAPQQTRSHPAWLHAAFAVHTSLVRRAVHDGHIYGAERQLHSRLDRTLQFSGCVSRGGLGARLHAAATHKHGNTELCWGSPLLGESAFLFRSFQ